MLLPLPYGQGYFQISQGVGDEQAGFLLYPSHSMEYIWYKFNVHKHFRISKMYSREAEG